MTVDDIVHNRVALMLGDALVRKVAMEAQIEALAKQVAELKAEAEANRPHPEDPDRNPGQ